MDFQDSQNFGNHKYFIIQYNDSPNRTLVAVQPKFCLENLYIVLCHINRMRNPQKYINTLNLATIHVLPHLWSLRYFLINSHVCFWKYLWSDRHKYFDLAAIFILSYLLWIMYFFFGRHNWLSHLCQQHLKLYIHA